MDNKIKLDKGKIKGIPAYFPTNVYVNFNKTCSKCGEKFLVSIHTISNLCNKCLKKNMETKIGVNGKQ